MIQTILLCRIRLLYYYMYVDLLYSKQGICLDKNEDDIQL